MRVDVCFPTSSGSYVGTHEMCELLYELPGVPSIDPGEPFLNELNGFDGQREIGGDSEYLFIGGRATRIWGEGTLGVLARSHAFILSVGEGGEAGA